MSNRLTRSTAALLVAAAVTAILAAPGIPNRAAAASCTAWTSESQPPPAIRVYRVATGAVETVEFRTYLKNVLSREWISSWTTESLRAGALAVRAYAWYQVLHYRGFVTSGGACFDVFDSTRDQVYDPARPIYPGMAAAVDATWATLVTRDGHIFPAYYNGGAAGEACGANANGWKLYQWGSQACGLTGRSAAQILTAYYAGATVAAAPPVSTPPPTASALASPTPMQTPVPTALPTPTPAPSLGTASPAATPSAPPTSPPTPFPTPPPSAAPSAPAAMPGGGQSGVVNAPAPPPPPPPDPTPIVVTASTASAAGPLAAPAPIAIAHRHTPPAWLRAVFPMRRVLEWPERSVWLGAAWPASTRPPALEATGPRPMAFRTMSERLAARVVRLLAAALLERGAIAAVVPPG